MAELPSLDNVLLLVQNIRKGRDFRKAQHVYALICEHGLEAQHAVGNHVIPMLVACGGLLQAERAFQKLAHCNVHAWTSFISGFVECGQCNRAFELHGKMLEANVHPTSHTYVALLKACTVLRDIDKGCKTHSQSAQGGFKHDVFVGSTLIDMYFKFGMPSEAYDVFNSLPAEDVVVWNTLITGHVEHCSFEEGLVCFDKMTEQSSPPNVVTFACALKACGHLGKTCRGQALHFEIVLRAFETECLLANTLIDLYAKCNCMNEAQAVFDSITLRDVVSWNALITGYVEHACFGEALKAFYQMRNEGIFPDAITLVCGLRGCVGMGRIEGGLVIGATFSHSQSRGDNFVGNTLVDLYAKCGVLREAQKVFDELSSQDVVSWNALIAGYTEHGYHDQALQCFFQMQSQNVVQDATTYICILKSCSSIQNLDIGRAMHGEVSQKGLEMHLFVGSSLVEFYFKCYALQEAEDTFNRLPNQDVTIWNAMIAGYVEQRCYEKGLTCLEQMRMARLLPNPATFSSSLKACGLSKDTVKGRDLHNEAALMGMEADLFVGSALVDMYTICHRLADARNCFDKLAVKDVGLWNALVAGYAACGASQEALGVYEQMHRADVCPNEVTFVCALRACGNLGVIEIGRSIHMEMLKRGSLCNSYVGNSLVNMYVMCGSLLEAWEVFSQLTARDVISWNTLIKGCGINHDGNMAVRVFEDMCKHGVQPDAITFTCLLTACSRSSLVIKGQEVFKIMCEEFDVMPSNYHYNCILDLHARVGCLHDMDEFWQAIPCFPTEVLWTVLLEACKIFSNAEAGAKCFSELVQVNSECATAYMLMANICAIAEGRVHADEVAEVKRIMTTKELQG